MTIKQILEESILKLKLKKIKNPHLNAEILLSTILKKQREFILSHTEYKLTKLQIKNYQTLINRRINGEPIAYLIGHKEFYGFNFNVNKNVLIPRPETELMVGEALKFTNYNSQPTTLIDIGTGSGCIIITLAKLLNQKPKNQKLIGIDISKKALLVAKQNALAHNVNKKIKFIKGNLLQPIIHNSKFITPNSKILILANLPYVCESWKKNYSVDSIGLKFEPQIALFTGKNGLELYEKLFKQINELQNKNYKFKNNIDIFCEFDPSQTILIKKLIKEYFKNAKLQIKKDLAGYNRLAIIKFQ
ncbi:peptide chain release factor N(5)-glutamine methyltransferase [Patescibacteria group bacterium]|nr:peptide chain release factor N(5)-glutamine methyltransferase [Patescibacteria group bacterium]MBU0879313.1 peptide chain release factor N(5)-glutamine methyltransferase [Patescibacteria group bacterium]MBU0880018.1 peptide chain release factor N(5)-glutamine methyltransferase [Patescibacteria group bacterium]MBU1063082.1 peptide chain release factor N(5)-glutamine methyltransferase [Patescibacteria group bacterium]MBU1783337.1 peptide chain release factor N(5)-glutamine methyltransferase [P